MSPDFIFYRETVHLCSLNLLIQSRNYIQRDALRTYIVIWRHQHTDLNQQLIYWDSVRPQWSGIECDPRGSSRVKAIASSSARANHAARAIEGRSISNEKMSISSLMAATASRADMTISNIPGVEQRGIDIGCCCSNKLDIARTRCTSTICTLREWVCQNIAKTRAHLYEKPTCYYTYVGVTQFNINGLHDAVCAKNQTQITHVFHLIRLS